MPGLQHAEYPKAPPHSLEGSTSVALQARSARFLLIPDSGPPSTPPLPSISSFSFPNFFGFFFAATLIAGAFSIVRRPLPVTFATLSRARPSFPCGQFSRTGALLECGYLPLPRLYPLNRDSISDVGALGWHEIFAEGVLGIFAKHCLFQINRRLRMADWLPFWFYFCLPARPREERGAGRKRGHVASILPFIRHKSDFDDEATPHGRGF
jgi:hypothetical protein